MHIINSVTITYHLEVNRDVTWKDKGSNGIFRIWGQNWLFWAYFLLIFGLVHQKTPNKSKDIFLFPSYRTLDSH